MRASRDWRRSRTGGKAVGAGRLGGRHINADLRFHEFVYELSGNTLSKPTMEAQWTYTQHVMGEVLMRDEQPSDIWDQHEALLVRRRRRHVCC